MRYLLLVVAIVLFVRGCASAQTTSTQSNVDQNQSRAAGKTTAQQDVHERLDALERRLEQLEKRVNDALPPNVAAVAATTRFDELEQKVKLLEHSENVQPGPSVTAGRDTFSITSRDKSFRLRIGGHLQVDSKTFPDNSHLLTNAFNIRRARPILEASLGHYVDFRFMPDFGNGQSVVFDAYADVKVKHSLVVRGGKFKTPLGLEVLQNDADRTFVENALPSDLVPNRDEGFQLYGDIRHRLTYQAAVVNGAPDDASIDGSTHNGKDVVGRIFTTPFAVSGPEALKGLGVGIAAARGPQDEGATLPAFKSTGGQATFFSFGTKTVTPFADGRRLNYVPQLYYYFGPFGLMAEYADSVQRVAATTNGNTTRHDVESHAWQVAGSWVLTGEKKSYKSIVPRKTLESVSSPGFGAWELVARYTELNVDPAVFGYGFADPTKSASAARSWAVGANWYLNFFTKFQFEYEQTRFMQGAAIGNRPTERVLEERLQIAF